MSPRTQSRSPYPYPEPIAPGTMQTLTTTAGWMAVALLTCSCSSLRPEDARSTRPNILILYTDDQGYGDCSALNPASGFVTPNLDRLAAEGMAFRDAHSADSICTPSRYALLTGRYAWRTRLKRGVLGADADCLLGDQQTIAEFLKTHGYHTGIVGKWHLGMQIPGTRGKRTWTDPVTDGPLQHGFDSFFGIPASMNYGVLTWFDGDRALEPTSMWTRKKFPPSEITARPKDYRMAPPYEQEPRGKQDIEVAPNFRDEDCLRIITDNAVAFLDGAARNRDQPFFLYVPFTSPHLPHCTAPEFRGKSTMGNYGDFMLETDARVGTILNALDRLHLAENTLVIFSSDNGPENNYRDWLRIYGHRSSGKFRGGKRDVYEGGHRVPFLVRWPQEVSAGKTCDTPICQTDVFATIAELLEEEVRTDAAVDSESFWPQLQGRPARTRGAIVHHSGSGHFAIRDGDHKLLLYRPGNRGQRSRTPAAQPDQVPFELYNLAKDPTESNDIAGSSPSIVAKLRARMTEIVQRGRSTPGPDQPNAGPAWWPQLTWIPRPK